MTKGYMVGGGGVVHCVCVTVQFCFKMCLCLYSYYLYLYVLSAIKNIKSNPILLGLQR